MPIDLSRLSSKQLSRAAALRERIEALEKQLGRILGADLNPVSASTSPTAIRRKPKISPEGRARIAAAQRARWAKRKQAATPTAASAPSIAPAKAKGRKRTMSPEARAKIAAAQKARWAKVKASKKAK